MWEKLPEENRKKMNIAAFVVGPIAVIAGFVIGTKVFQVFGHETDMRGMIFVGFGVIVMYILAVMRAYQRLQARLKK